MKTWDFPTHAQPKKFEFFVFREPGHVVTTPDDKMASLWQFIATFALPAPLALLILLNSPVPKSLKKTVLLLVARIFEFPVLGNTIKLLHLMLLTLVGALLLSIQTLRSLKEPAETPSSMYEAVRLNKRWRAERNMWLSAFAFTMWTVLAVFYREMARRLRVEERLAEFETSDCTGTIDSAARDVSVSKEVTSRQVLSPRGVGMVSGGSPIGIKEAVRALSSMSGGSTGGGGKHGKDGKDGKDGKSGKDGKEGGVGRFAKKEK